MTFLASDVVAKTRAGAAQAAAREVEFVASQLEQESQAERAVLAEPERRAEVVAELSQVQQQTRRLVSPTATWQQTLSDGIQDLVADVEHDLQARLRTVIHDVEEIIDQGDPKDTWTDTEVWLRRQVAIVTVANRDMLMERAEELARTWPSSSTWRRRPGSTCTWRRSARPATRWCWRPPPAWRCRAASWRR